jgi:hypothetical protein
LLCAMLSGACPAIAFAIGYTYHIGFVDITR